MKRYFILFTIIVLPTMILAQANSYYSVYGLGVPQHLVSAQASGMGGAGIGVQQYLAYNSMNPAAVFLNGLTTISASFNGELAENFVGDESAKSRQGNAAGFQFGFPMFKDRASVLVSVKPLVKSQLTVAYAEETEDFNLEKTIQTSGGITAASLGFNYVLLPSLTLGAMFDFNFGAYNEEWKTEFDNDTYLNATDNIASHVWGNGAEVGLFFRPIKSVSLGAMLKTASKLTIETIKTTGGGVKMDPINQTALYPTSFGAGIAFDLNKFLIATDYYSQLWKDYKIDGIKENSLTNYMRIGGGVQYRGSEDYIAKYYDRIVYRIGASYAQLPFLDANGDAVTEVAFSGGVGFPFNKNAGRIDIAVAYGQRKSTDDFLYSEKFVRITASVTMAEKWFQRNY